MILYKTTNRLFRGQYQFKVVLTVPGASIFRSGDMGAAYKQLEKINIDQPKDLLYYRATIKTQSDLDYAFKLQATLSKLEDTNIRVESPWVTVYTNTKKVVDKLTKIDESRVKYVCAPPENKVLCTDTIILPKVDFEFKVTLGKTIQEYSAFVDWAEANSKVKLTKLCIKELRKPTSWGGSYFYITGEKNLLMAKMHLGGCINKVERIIKP